MELKQLQRQIPYQWRVQSFSKFKSTASCVAYIDARDVMVLLDEVCGPENWQSDFKDVAGRIFSGIGIRVGDHWIWKWDTGADSDIEKEKGQASDSFKRAAVKWGIGRFLYDLPIKTVTTDGAKTEAHKYPSIVDGNGQKVYDLTKHLNATLTPPVAQKSARTATKPAPSKQETSIALAASKDRLKWLLSQHGHKGEMKVKEVKSAVREITGKEYTGENIDDVNETLSAKLEAMEVQE